MKKVDGAVVEVSSYRNGATAPPSKGEKVALIALHIMAMAANAMAAMRSAWTHNMLLATFSFLVFGLVLLSVCYHVTRFVIREEIENLFFSHALMQLKGVVPSIRIISETKDEQPEEESSNG